MYYLSTHFPADWKLCNQGKKLEIWGKDLAGSPVIQLNYPTPLFHLISLGKWLFQAKNKSRGHLLWAQNSFVPAQQWKLTVVCRCLPSSGSLPTCWHEQRCRARRRRGEAGTSTTRSEARRCAAGADLGHGDPDLGLTKVDLYCHALGQRNDFAWAKDWIREA